MEHGAKLISLDAHFANIDGLFASEPIMIKLPAPKQVCGIPD